MPDLATEECSRSGEPLFAGGDYSHTGADGSRPSERARAAGYQGARLVTENIAKGLFEPDEVVERWMNSRGHRRNILHRQVREVGSGVAFGERDDEFEVVWVQLLATR